MQSSDQSSKLARSHDAIQVEVDEERVALLYRRAPVALLTVVVNGALLIAFLVSQIAAPVLIGWGIALAVITAARAALVWAYFAHPARLSTAGWENAFVSGALVNGLAWGLGTAAFLTADLEYQVAVLFVLGGMIAGASSSSATSRRSYLSYAIPAAIPGLGMLVFKYAVQDSPSHGVLGVTSLIFVSAMAYLAHQGGVVVTDAIRLRLHNKALDRELTERTRERAGRLQHLLDHAGVVTLVADPATSTVVDASKNVDDIFGCAANRLIGRALVGSLAYEPFVSLDSWRQLVRAAGDGKTTVTALLQGPQTIGRRLPEAPRSIELTATIHPAAGTDYVLVVLKDVTESRELESQLAQSHLLASLGTLSAGVAHEVNNPLAVVLTNLRLIQALLHEPSAFDDTTVDAALRTPVDEAVKSAERIRTTVSNLLNTTRIADDPNAVSDAQQVVEMLLQVAGTEIRHRAEVSLDVQPTPQVRADPLRLYQVLLPLVLQATQAIADGDVTRHRITVRLRHDHEDDMVRVDVEDTGPPLSAEEASRIFEPLASASDGRGAKFGLSFCRRVVQQLGGTIEASSAGDVGARFTLRLPAAPPPRADATAGPDSAIAGPLRILIVDDDAYVARALKRLLRDHDVTIDTEAHAALDRLDEGDAFDVILSDLMMPDLSGVEFHREVERRDADLARRIVFMTGGAFTDLATAFLSRIDNPCLTKPFELSTLQAALARAAPETLAR